MSTHEASSLRLVLTLSCAGLIAGLTLAGVFLATKQRIADNHAAALRRAILQVVPGAVGFDIVQNQGQQLVRIAEGAAPPDDAEVAYSAHDADGRHVGWAIAADGAGFMDTVRLIYGFDDEREVIVGMVVLDSRETPGLGDKIAYDKAFLENFAALAVEPEIVAVKHGTKTRPNEVDCITGATISSKAVTSILEHSIRHWLPVLRSVQAGSAPLSFATMPQGGVAPLSFARTSVPALSPFREPSGSRSRATPPGAARRGSLRSRSRSLWAAEPLLTDRGAAGP